MNRTELGLVDLSVLQNKRGHVDTIADLVNRELKEEAPSDVVLFLGPMSRFGDKVPTVIFGPGGPPVYCPDEHLPVADIHEATKVYAMFAALALTGHPDANEAGYAAGGR